VSEIDKACNRHEVSVGEPSGTQSKSLQQKTLDSFIRGGGSQRSTAVINERVQHGGALDFFRGQKSVTEAEFRTRQISSDGAEASTSGCSLPLDYEAAKVWVYPGILNDLVTWTLQVAVFLPSPDSNCILPVFALNW
jgi:hypothetical protein